MINDLKTLILRCKDELHDREYTASHAELIINEWEAIQSWFQENHLTEFNRESGYLYCDTVIGSHVIVDGMTDAQKRQLRAVRMLITYQEDGDFEFRSPRGERTFPGDTGKWMLLHLQSEKDRGLSESTLQCKRIYLYRLNNYLIQKGIGFDGIDIDVMEDFFSKTARSLATRHNCANHLRQLFHYLYNHHCTDTNLSQFILKDRYRNKCRLPTTYTEDEIRRILGAVDRSSAMGRRDYLILLLAAQYGWRSGDIVKFRLSQIDWENNVIFFDQGKTGAPAEYPLLASVGNAVIDYLRYGRPESDAPEVIVSSEAGKRGTPLKRPAVHAVVSRYMREADIPHWQEKKHGPHALRHSLATNLLRKDVPLPVISAVLGHQSTQSTGIYLRIDVDRLSLCVLPMPSLESPFYMEVSANE